MTCRKRPAVHPGASACMLTGLSLCALLCGSLFAATDRAGEPLPEGAVARLGSASFKHDAHISGIAYLPGGERMLTVSGTGLRLWQTGNRRMLKHLPFRSPQPKLAVSSTGHLAAVGTYRGEVIVVGTEDFVERIRIPLRGPVMDLVFQGDQRLFVSSLFEGIRLATASFDLESGKEERSFGQSRSIVLHPSGKWLACLFGGRATLSDPASGKTVREVKCSAMSFSPDGERAAVVSEEKASILNTQTWKEELSLSLAGGHAVAGDITDGGACVFAPDGKHVAWRQGEVLCIWDLAANDLKTVKGIYAFAFSPDLDRIAVSKINALRFLDPRTGLSISPPGIEYAHEGPVDAMCVSADGLRCYSTARDGTIRVWDIASGRCLATWPWKGPSIAELACSPDHRWLAAGHLMGLALLDAKTGKEVKTLTFAAPKKPPLDGEDTCCVLALAFSHSGQFLACGDENGRIRLLRSATGEFLREFQGHGKLVRGVAFSPDDRFIASVACGDDRTLRVWDLETGHESACYLCFDQLPQDVVWCPDGRHVVTAWSRVRRYDLTTGEQKELYRVRGSIEPVLAGMPSRTGVVVTSGEKGEIVFLGLDGARLATLQSDNIISQLAFTPDGSRMVSSSNDGTLLVWDTTSIVEHVPTAAPVTVQIKPTGSNLSALIAYLEGSDESTRELALARIQKLGPQAKEAIPALMRLLPPITLEDEKKLKPYAERTEEDVSTVLDDQDAKTLEEAVLDALEGMGPEVFPHIRQLYEDSVSVAKQVGDVSKRLDQRIQRSAAYLGRCIPKDPTLAPLLFNSGKAEYRMLRGARHIREGGPEAAKFLIAAAETEDPEDRCAAVVLLMNETHTPLGERGGLDFGPHRARAAEVLAKRLLDDEGGPPFNEAIPCLAINALAGLGEEGLKPLADAAANHPKGTVREQASAALATLKAELEARKEAARRKAAAQSEDVAQRSDEPLQTDTGGWSANQVGLAIAAALLYVMVVVTVFKYRKFRRERAAKPH